MILSTFRTHFHTKRWLLLILPLIALAWMQNAHQLSAQSDNYGCTAAISNLNVQQSGDFGFSLAVDCPGGLSNWALLWDIGSGVTVSNQPSGGEITVAADGTATLRGSEMWSQNLTAQQSSHNFYIQGSGALNQTLGDYQFLGLPPLGGGSADNSDSTPGSGGANAIVPDPGAARCSTALRYDNAWLGGAVVNIAIFNNTGSDINDWEMTFDWPEATGATIDDYWVAADVQINGTTVTASGASDVTGDINHNAIRSFGFVISGAGIAANAAKPYEFMVNGQPCNPQGGQTFPGQNFGGTLPILSDPDHWGRNPVNTCQQRFFELYDAIHDPENGYIDEEGIPYHAVEELNVEAPDYGHVTTSEAFSYLILLEAAYGKMTGDWSALEKAWAIMEHTIIPDASQQPTWENHTFSQDNGVSVATYAPENHNGPENYPSPLNPNINEGTDPIYGELNAHWNGGDASNSGPQYLMHWLLDVDNTYNFGGDAPGYTLGNSVYINTFQRGAQESTWETVPHPSYENMSFGSDDGFLNIFIQDGSYTPQWRYTNAPDAEGRAIEAVRLAELWGGETNGQIVPIISKAAKMADYLRYDMFDKYFMPIGCETASDPMQCTTGTGNGTYDGAHDLLAWYTSWGAPLEETHDWAFLIGASDAHFGYQDPWAAWVIANDDTWSDPGSGLPGISPNGRTQWENSYQRQMELYLWLQSDADGTDADGNLVPAGAFAGGVTNSVDGTYSNATSQGPHFYGMAYDDNPVYHDPGSNTWFGFQVWSGQRYMMTLKEVADAGQTVDAALLDAADDWANMAINVTKIDYNGAPFALPSGIDWGDPATSKPAGDYSGGGFGTMQDVNTNLQMDVKSYGQDVGVAASLARTLLAYSQISGAVHAVEAGETATELMDALWSVYGRDSYGVEGVAMIEHRGDYRRFWDEIYIPAGNDYTLGDGSTVSNGANFADIHWFYEDSCEGITTLDQSDPSHRTCAQFCEVADAFADTNGDGTPINRAPAMLYHRFWAQVDNAMALVEADDFGFSCGTFDINVTTTNDSIPMTDPANIPAASSLPVACETVQPLAAPVPIDTGVITPIPTAVSLSDAESAVNVPVWLVLGLMVVVSAAVAWKKIAD